MLKINWKYALGEIAIVIIGITIAFTLNNLAGKKKDQKTERLYLQNIINDLQYDVNSLKNNVELLKANVDIVSDINKSLAMNTPQKDSVLLKFLQLAKPIDFVPKDATYRMLINSGDLKIISDFKIKSIMQEHYDSYKILLKNYERRESFNKEFLGDFFINRMDYKEIQKGNFDFMHQKYFANILNSIRGILFIKMESSSKTMQKGELLIQDIQKYLDNL